jgi:predicted DNA-binding antitoxin AbrB/MazE fold protein
VSKIIRARYEKGVLKPLEPLDLEEGEELILEVRELHSVEGIRRFFGIVKLRKRKIEEEDYYEYVSERGSVPG